MNVPTEINAGDTITLEGKVYPSNAEDSTIIWSSDNFSVVSVSSSGKLKAVGGEQLLLVPVSVEVQHQNSNYCKRNCYNTTKYRIQY